ncbi:MAG TPA: YdcF family protein [Terriglobia bacterium]|nr:YdcF family protein [Terriglobia bacterium]
MSHHGTLLKDSGSLPGEEQSSQHEKVARQMGRRWIWAVAIIGTLIVAFIVLLHFGGYALVHTDPLPKHADVALVLDGGQVGLRARTAEGVRLLQQGIVGYLLLSLPPKTYWGKSVPAEAFHYFKRHFGNQVASHIAFCVSDADSTIEEAGVVRQCLKNAGWRKVIIVTSNYHTRRAGNIWRAALAGSQPAYHLWVHGVRDGSFEPRGWWLNRIYAKTWLFETSKLAWESIFGDGPWQHPPIKGKFFNPASWPRPAVHVVAK